MQTEVSTNSLDDSTRRLLGDGVVFCIVCNTVFQTHSNITVGPKTLLGHNALQINENVIQYTLYGVWHLNYAGKTDEHFFVNVFESRNIRVFAKKHIRVLCIKQLTLALLGAVYSFVYSEILDSLGILRKIGCKFYD